MCKNYLRHLNEKVLALISLIINFIASIFLIVYNNKASETRTINAIEKLINGIINIIVLFKDSSCCKKKIIEKSEDSEKKDNNAFEDGKRLLDTFYEAERIIENLKKMANEGQKKEQEDIKELLKNIKKQKEMFINIII